MNAETSFPNAYRRIRLGVFFSHSTQHHSPLFRALADDPRLEVTVYYYDPQEGMYDSGFGRTETWDIDLRQGFRSHVLFNLLRGRSVRITRQINPGVITVFARNRFDAVFLSGYASPSNWLVLLLARLIGAHVLYQSDTNILDDQRKKRSRLGKWLRGLFLAQVDTYLVAGDKNREFYLSYGLYDRKMIWCPIPVDVGRFAAARLDPNLDAELRTLREQYFLPSKAKVVVFCGKLIDRKRPQDFIEAIHRLDRPDVYGLLLGSGPLERTISASLQPNERIRLVGFVNQSAIPYFMLLADVGVIASEWDPHPLVATEFAACGLPVIASHYAGVWGPHDILRPGENGFVYACGDVSELVVHLERLLDDEPLRQAMGRRSLELVQGQSVAHAAEAIASRLSEVMHPGAGKGEHRRK